MGVGVRTCEKMMSTSVLVNREDRRSHSLINFANMKLSMASELPLLPPPNPQNAWRHDSSKHKGNMTWSTQFCGGSAGYTWSVEIVERW